jgi:drug/metabolite transporter (DMT)-like permease
MQWLVGTVWMVASALSYGAMNICVKLGSSHLTVWQTAMGRFVLGLAVIPFVVRLFRGDLLGQARWLLLARGVSGTLGFLLMIQAMKMIPLSMAMVLFYLWPVFTCMLSPWVAGEPTTRREWPFVGAALLGTVLILWPDRAGPGLNPGHFLALGSSLFTGLAAILIRRLRRSNNPFTIYFYYCLSGSILCIMPFLTQGPPALQVSTTGWLLLGAVAVLAMAGQTLMNQGMKYLNAAKTGALMMIEVIVAAAFGAIYLGESLTLRFFLGSILILGCGVALTVLPARFPKNGAKA